MSPRTAWLPLLALLASLLLPAAAPARTGDDSAPIDLQTLDEHRKARQRKYQLGRRVQRYLAAAGEANEEEGPERGLALLDRLKLSRLNPHERAYVFRLRAFLNYVAGDHEAAIENFEKMLDEEVMSVHADNRARYNVAQIYASLEQWNEAIAALNRWFRYVESPDPQAYYLLGIAHYHRDDTDAAIAATEKAVDLAPEPEEGWLQLLSALYIKKEDFASATPILEELVMRFPKKLYWVQLSLIYGARENYRHSLAVQQVAYLQGFLTEDRELRRLARSYLYHELPLPAAELLEKAIAEDAVEADAEAYEMLANSWIAAREFDRALEPLEKAAELSDDGNLFVRLGQVHLQREEWRLASEELRKAVAKGGLKDPGNAQLLLGIAYYNDQRIAQARASFARARVHDSTRERAENWITHIENESRTSEPRA